MFNTEKLRELRERKGLTTKQLGEMVGCNGSFITHLEVGRKEPSGRLLHYLAEALGCSMDDFYKED